MRKFRRKEQVLDERRWEVVWFVFIGKKYYKTKNRGIPKIRENRVLNRTGNERPKWPKDRKVVKRGGKNKEKVQKRKRWNVVI